MSELTVEQLLKIILGICVVVAITIGLYFIFRNQIVEFLKGLPLELPTKFFMSIIR